MHTIPIHPKLANRAVPLPLEANGNAIPRYKTSSAGIEAPAAPATRERTEKSTFSDLDAMLIADPNMGAIHGLRVAMLFNAGLALSGLMIWEIWNMIAS
jgi:hypothetical protein